MACRSLLSKPGKSRVGNGLRIAEIEAGGAKNSSILSRARTGLCHGRKSRILCRAAELRSAAEIESVIISSSELRIKQINTRWKENFRHFPMDILPSSDSSQPNHDEQNKSSAVSEPGRTCPKSISTNSSRLQINQNLVVINLVALIPRDKDQGDDPMSMSRSFTANQLIDKSFQQRQRRHLKVRTNPASNVMKNTTPQTKSTIILDEHKHPHSNLY